MAHNLCCLNLRLLTITGLLAVMSISQANLSWGLSKPQDSSRSMLLKEFVAEGFDDLLSNAVIQDNRIFFAATSSIHGKELWVSDGTSQGTNLLKDLVPGKRSAQPKLLAGNGSTFWFQIDDRNQPLWQSNGTSSGTVPVNGLSSGMKATIDHNNPISPIVSNGNLLFAYLKQNTPELWRVTPTAQPKAEQFYRFATTPGRNFYPQSYNVVGNQVLFAVTTSNGPTQLWQTDGTRDGTRTIAPVTPSTYAVWQNRLYMEAESPGLGWELWISDGTKSGTKLLKDLNPGSENGVPRLLTGIGSNFFVVVNTPEGEELWATQGTSETTRRIKRLNNAPSFRAERSAITIGNQMYFAIVSGDGKWYLWRTDGTEKGTQRLTQTGLNGITELTVVGNRVFFSGASKDGTEPWVSDGTPNGTKQIKDLFPGTTLIVSPCLPPPPIGRPFDCPPPQEVPLDSSPRSITAFGDRAYFIATTGGKTDLWVSDGTAAGTKVVMDVIPNGSYSRNQLMVIQNKLLFTRFDPTRQKLQLWALPKP